MQARPSFLALAALALAPVPTATALTATGAPQRAHLDAPFEPGPGWGHGLTVRPPRPGCGDPTLRFEGGPRDGFVWLSLAGGDTAAVGARPPGELLSAGRLDSAGAREWTLPSALLQRDLGAHVHVLALPADGDWSSAVRTRLGLGPWTAGGSRQLVHQTGPLVITEFMKDPAAVPDSAGEWVELFNPTNIIYDLEGWTLSDLGSNSVVLTNGGQGIAFPPGSYFVLGRESDPTLNGGVAVDYVYTGFTLSNGADEIILTAPGGSIADQIGYDDGVTWPDEPGRSISLARSAHDPWRNDGGSSWCHTPGFIAPGGPDTGTPGAPNEICP